MALNLAVSVSRPDLGLPDLNVNDHIRYIVAPGFMGGQVTWARNQVSSPYVDGDITISRRRPSITENIVIHVHGSNGNTLRANLANLINAFLQNKFNLTVTMNGADYQYQCETSDYAVEWGQEKLHSNMYTVTFSVLRKPIAIQGV